MTMLSPLEHAKILDEILMAYPDQVKLREIERRVAGQRIVFRGNVIDDMHSNSGRFSRPSIAVRESWYDTELPPPAGIDNVFAAEWVLDIEEEESPLWSLVHLNDEVEVDAIISAELGEKYPCVVCTEHYVEFEKKTIRNLRITLHYTPMSLVRIVRRANGSEVPDDQQPHGLVQPFVPVVPPPAEPWQQDWQAFLRQVSGRSAWVSQQPDLSEYQWGKLWNAPFANRTYRFEGEVDYDVASGSDTVSIIMRTNSHLSPMWGECLTHFKKEIKIREASIDLHFVPGQSGGLETLKEGDRIVFEGKTKTLFYGGFLSTYVPSDQYKNACFGLELQEGKLLAMKKPGIRI